MVTPIGTHACATCGAQLDSNGECTACLLQLGISQAAETSNSVHPGDLPTIAELNQQFPQLEVTRLIGRGGMGAIYHARQKALDRDVALKLISKAVSSDPAFVERFEREAKTLAKLSHPNIVTIFDFGRTAEGDAFLVMEYVDGINLRNAINGDGFQSDEALAIVATICKALAYAHSKGVVHRDIKPENILLGEDGAVKVADFGIAKIIDESVRTPTLTATRQVLGSLHYLAPEHLEAPEDVDHRVDLYALGVIFYELLTGQLPLGRFEAPSVIRSGIDPQLDSIVLKSLSRKPNQRYQHVAELETDVNALLDVQPRASATPIPAASPTTPKAVGVPFTCDAMSGFAEAVGIVHARENTLCAEFRIRDAFGGSVKSKTHVVEVPREKMTNLEFVSGVFGSKLVITADTISALGTFPEAETGRAHLKIKRPDEALARELVRALGFGSNELASSQWSSVTNSNADPNHVVFAILMLLCGCLNGGGLAVAETFIADRIRDDVALVAAAVGTAVTLGPIALIQLVTGVINFFGQPRALNMATCIISMFPLTPVWLLSFPTAAWAYRWLTREGQPHAATDSQVGWGTTTMLFLRESRWSKAMGIGNAIAAVTLLAGITTYNFGYYPTKLNYRVVNSNVEIQNLEAALEARLSSLDGTQRLYWNSKPRPTRLTIKTLRRHAEPTHETITLPNFPQLAWLQADELAASQQASGKSIAVNSGLDTSGLRIESSPVGDSVFSSGDLFDLHGNDVKAITKLGRSQLALELTSEGRHAFEVASVGTAAPPALALVIEGLVAGIAVSDSITPQKIVFQLPDSAADINIDSVSAAIRGPAIPSDLERLGSGS